MIVEINKIKYLTIETFITASNQYKINKLIKKHECIDQGIKEVNRGGFWGETFAITIVLVPEKNVLKFQEDMLNRRTDNPNNVSSVAALSRLLYRK